MDFSKTLNRLETTEPDLIEEKIKWLSKPSVSMHISTLQVKSSVLADYFSELVKCSTQSYYSY